MGLRFQLLDELAAFGEQTQKHMPVSYLKCVVATI